MPKSSQGHNIEKTSQLFKIVTHTDIKTQEVRKMYVEHEYKIMKLFCDMFLRVMGRSELTTEVNLAACNLVHTKDCKQTLDKGYER